LDPVVEEKKKGEVHLRGKLGAKYTTPIPAQEHAQLGYARVREEKDENV